MTEAPRPKAILEQVFWEKSARDKQVKIGPSLAGSPCSRCVAEGLAVSAGLAQAEPQSDMYRLASAIGTALHEFIEHRMVRLYPEARLEQKNVIGELPGYGTISGSTDCYLYGTVYDWKTTTRAKLDLYKANSQVTKVDPSASSAVRQAQHTLLTYRGQATLYGLGWEKAGLPVQNLGLGFVVRAGLTRKDIDDMIFPYDSDKAHALWGRIEKIWAALTAGRELDTIASSPGCYTCEREGRV